MKLSFPAHEDQADLRAAVRSLCARFPLEYWDRHDLDKEFPQEFFEAFAEAGYLGVLVPEEYGGGGGTMSQMAAILEEVSAAGGALNAASSVHIPILAVPTLLAFGSEEQRKEHLPKIAAGELFVTFGVTEPDAGTETTRIKTAARRVDGGWLINGSKVWNTGALRGDRIMLLARTGEPGEGRRKGEGLTLFLADLKAPSVDIKAISKIGRNAVASTEVFFNDLFVSDADVIGEVDQGFYHLLYSLNGERILVSAEALGIARWALENGARYAQERVVFDRPIGKNQAVQHPLAKAYLQVLAASEVMSRTIEIYEEKGGRAVGVMANGLKFLASEAEAAATDAAMQTYGGYSFAREYHIGRHWIEARLQRIAPINNQMILNSIAESALGLPRSY
ncbi:acyl-CoA dehydrogenase (plasmid) [Pseudonocardia sp. EC080610-09]|uniref:acyl-CoA dehydrogenase family protein n=2 Tax=Pseudonocardia TaxID=1847 RepID=UPI0007062935|nr:MULTISPECIES: acyl-CoA dehydrogenase family protein [unclassified Pseudonocardia]ALL79768.1 acyl-CoA dehydrogenase [Pseudonocardia sp. EC080610-09]ALL85204.1 acyl-CoA dehydrogenase [Pseudonocardia sp. EC080619-01]